LTRGSFNVSLPGWVLRRRSAVLETSEMMLLSVPMVTASPELNPSTLLTSNSFCPASADVESSVVPGAIVGAGVGVVALGVGVGVVGEGVGRVVGAVGSAAVGGVVGAAEVAASAVGAGVSEVVAGAVVVVDVESVAVVTPGTRDGNKLLDSAVGGAVGAGNAADATTVVVSSLEAVVVCSQGKFP